MKQKLLPLLTGCWHNNNSGSMEPCTYSQAQVPGQPVRLSAASAIMLGHRYLAPPASTILMSAAEGTHLQRAPWP